LTDKTDNLRRYVGRKLDRFCDDMETALAALRSRWLALQGDADSDGVPPEEVEDIELLWDAFEARLDKLRGLIPDPDRDDPGPTG
jgi:hypothetical protein